MAGDTGTTLVNDAVLKTRIKAGTELDSSLGVINGKLNGISAEVNAGLVGRWGDAQTTAVNNVATQVRTLQGIVNRRTAYLNTYLSKTQTDDDSAGKNVTRGGAAVAAVNLPRGQ